MKIAKIKYILCAMAVIFTLASCAGEKDRVIGYQSTDIRGDAPEVVTPDITPDITPDNTENSGEDAPVVAQPEVEPVVEYRTTFVGVGDNIIYGTKQAKRDALDGGRQYNYKNYYTGMHDIIASADISFINQETLMCGDGWKLSYYPRFNSPQDVGYDLVEMGFDVINIANNHMLDKGAEGLTDTIAFWKGMDTLMIGGYENAEDFDSIRIIERNGLKIAFLSYTYGTNGLTLASNSQLVVPYINDEDIVRQTALAHQVADMVFVSMHWGVENKFTTTADQERLAQLLADCEVDAIIGHHPHVIQPVEWVTGKNGNKTLCVYSLGNFMAQQDMQYNMLGGMISFDIVHSSEKEPTIENVVYTPIVFHFDESFYNNSIYKFEDYTPELANAHGVRMHYGNRMSYDTLLGYINDTIDPEFLPDFFKAQPADAAA